MSSRTQSGIHEVTSDAGFRHGERNVSTYMILTAITFFIILTILVLIHELGHFTVARLIGVRVEEFGLGLPPRIWGKQFGNTQYTLNWLPIGGFVRLAGEDDDESQKAKANGKKLKEYFWARSKKERTAILIAGVVMNFLLAVAITTGLLVHGVKEPTGTVRVETVVAGSPAESAGLLVGDVVVGLSTSEKGLLEERERVSPKTPKDLIAFINAHKGTMVYMSVTRAGTPQPIMSVVPRVEVPPGQGPLGVAISDLELRKYPLHEAPGKAVVINLMRARDMFVSLATTIGSLLSLKAPQADVAGPIGIAQVTGQAVKFGWLAVLEFASILSLNLAVLNILPIPALDGGRIAFVVLEKILGKKVHPAFEKSTHQIGMLILLGLIVLVSINDILRLVRGA